MTIEAEYIIHNHQNGDTINVNAYLSCDNLHIGNDTRCTNHIKDDNMHNNVINAKINNHNTHIINNAIRNNITLCTKHINSMRINNNIDITTNINNHKRINNIHNITNNICIHNTK